MSSPKEIQNKKIRGLVEAALAQGGALKPKNGSHLQVLCPFKAQGTCPTSSGLVTVSRSGSDHREFMNTRSQLRRCGFAV